MLVVADSSPLIVLIKIERIELLPKLFKEVLIPPAISMELRAPTRPQVVWDFITHPPWWLVERAPTTINDIPTLDNGECAAISLAQEVQAGLLLMDEDRGRKAAIDRQLRVTGTIGVLERAAAEGFVDLAEAFQRIKGTDFWIPHAFLDERLHRFLSNRKT